MIHYSRRGHVRASLCRVVTLGGLVGALLWVHGCSRRSPTTERPPEPVVEPLAKQDVDAGRPVEAAQPTPHRWPPPQGEPHYPPGPLMFAGLVVEDPRDSEAPVHLYPMRLEGDQLEIGAAMDLPRRERGAYPAVAALSPDLLYVGRGKTVERHRPFTKGVKGLSVPVADTPTALSGVEDLCYVGFRGKVGMIDFLASEPAFSMVLDELYANKPVDYFVRLGNRYFVAVDDRVFPKFAALFEWQPMGRVVHRFTSGLPAHPNEGYTGAVAAGEVLVITATFGVMRSSGNRLYRCRVTDAAFDCRELEDSWPGHGLSLATGDDPAWPIRLVAGSQTSYWQGLGVIGQRIFIGAGRRGIIHLAVDSDEARLLDVGGQCLDLFAVGDRVVALVREGPDQGMDTSGGRRVLVIYHWDVGGQSLDMILRHPIPQELDSLER